MPPGHTSAAALGKGLPTLRPQHHGRMAHSSAVGGEQNTKAINNGENRQKEKQLLSFVERFSSFEGEGGENTVDPLVCT